MLFDELKRKLEEKQYQIDKQKEIDVEKSWTKIVAKVFSDEPLNYNGHNYQEVFRNVRGW